MPVAYGTTKRWVGVFWSPRGVFRTIYIPKLPKQKKLDENPEQEDLDEITDSNWGKVRGEAEFIEDGSAMALASR